MNSCIFIGRICNDLELRYTQSGKATCTFSLAINKRTTNGENKADFLNFTAFGKTAEIIQKYFSKGHRIGITSHACQNTDKDGKKVNTVSFLVDTIEFIEKKSDFSNANVETPSPQTVNGFMAIPDGIEEELPFS